ncbi:MAG: hypothetical protein HYY18_21070 [Planctomycetes bacterium]|nr:hypothetical protein [Planctomycetota bacterium]
MKRFAEFALSLAAGPIQLRELRATFRGWRFMVIFTASLVIALFILWVAAFAFMTDREPSSEVGQVTFVVLLTVQAALIGLLLPGFAGTSIVRERDQSTLELLATTTIRPSQIVWGQFVASMGYVATYLFATLPLMAFPLWFGGLVGWEPVVAYIGLFLMAALIAMWSIYVSATSGSIARAVIMSYLFVFFLGGPLVGALVEIIEHATRGRGNLSEIIELISTYAWPIAVNAAWGFAAPFAFLFIAAVNRLKPIGANRALPVRLFTLACMPVTAAVMLGNYQHFTGKSGRGDRTELAFAFWVVLAVFAAAIAFMTTEGPLEGKRLVKQRAAWTGLRRPLRFLLPGGLRAFVFTLLLGGAVLAVSGWFVTRVYLWDVAEAAEAVGAVLAAIGALVVFGAGFGLYLGALRLTTTVARSVWFLGVIFVPIVGSIWQLAAYGDFPDIMRWDAPGYLVFPFVLYKTWYHFAEDKVMPEIGGHTPILVPFLIFHLGLGIVFAVSGFFAVLRREREARDAVFGPRAPAPAPAAPAPEPAS